MSTTVYVSSDSKLTISLFETIKNFPKNVAGLSTKIPIPRYNKLEIKTS